MSERTEHGDNIADQIQQEDAYGNFDSLTYSDLWNILDQFQTHLINTNKDDPMIHILSKWMSEIENIDDEVTNWI
jgi:hypothetical protein